jgi:Putative peptidoglycan binding domain
MSKLIRNLSSFISGRSAVVPLTGAAAAAAPQPASTTEPSAPSAPQAALPLVAYAVTPEEMASSPRLRRSRSVSLLRNSSGSAMTTTVLGTGAVRPHAPAHGSRPFLTQTERVRLQVMQAQIQLASLRLYEGPVDGVLSPATTTAVRYFQTLKGLRPSGTLAAGTLAALGVPTLD